MSDPESEVGVPQEVHEHAPEIIVFPRTPEEELAHLECLVADKEGHVIPVGDKVISLCIVI